MEKKNCWEVKNCGRELNGPNVIDLGVCPAAIGVKFDGIHGGNNGGRSCWMLAGTLCGGKVQGIYAQKYKNCLNCDFYQSVKQEEGKDFLMLLLQKS